MAKKRNINEGLVFPFDSENFMSHWNMLASQKKWRNKSQSALQMSLMKLSKHSEEVAIEAMVTAISGEYQGVFPESVKTTTYGKSIRESKAESIDNIQNESKRILDLFAAQNGS